MVDYVYLSRYRITYTPAGGSPLILLDEGDWCDGPLTLEPTLAVQTEQPILSPWAVHNSRGNAQMQLSFTHYATAASREAAQMAGLQRQMYMTAHPGGEILLETAWAGPTPQVSLKLHATLDRVSWLDESGECAPGNIWLALSYGFLVSPIEDTPSTD